MLNIAMGLQLDGFSAFPGLKRASILYFFKTIRSVRRLPPPDTP